MDRVYDDYNEMLKRQDIDAVDILVPIESNYTVSEAVAKAARTLFVKNLLLQTGKRQKNIWNFQKNTM